MPALITELIDRLDNSERVCEKIGAILLIESARQRELAVLAGKPDPDLWSLRVFTERSNTWDQFQDPVDEEGKANPNYDATPIVNVTFDQAAFDGSKGDILERQAADATFHIDCFGVGVSTDDPNGDGHFAGDSLAAVEAKRAARLVRSIIMSAAYVTLGFPLKPNPVIWKRWVSSIQMQTVGPSERVAQHIVAARISLAVTFNEFSPQIQGVPLELVSTEFKRADTGELVFIAAQFPIDQSAP